MISNSFAVLIADGSTDSPLARPEVQERLKLLAQSLNLPLVDTDSGHDAGYLLTCNAEGDLELRFARNPTFKGVQSGVKPRPQAARTDPLLRAVGLRSCEMIDGTAGLGVDAVHLAGAGHRVTAIEQHPVLFALLMDGYRRLEDRELASRFSPVHADSIQWLGNRVHEVDVIYLDPMYPPRHGSAASRKCIRLLQEIISYQPDRDRDMLRLARSRVRRRVVVKRPLHAEPLLPGNSGDIRGKMVRFDLYPPTDR